MGYKCFVRILPRKLDKKNIDREIASNSIHKLNTAAQVIPSKLTEITTHKDILIILNNDPPATTTQFCLNAAD